MKMARGRFCRRTALTGSCHARRSPAQLGYANGSGSLKLPLPNMCLADRREVLSWCSGGRWYCRPRWEAYLFEEDLRNHERDADGNGLAPDRLPVQPCPLGIKSATSIVVCQPGGISNLQAVGSHGNTAWIRTRPTDFSEAYKPGLNSRNNLVAQMQRGRTCVPLGFKERSKRSRRAKKLSGAVEFFDSFNGLCGTFPPETFAAAFIGAGDASSKAGACDVPSQLIDSAEAEAERTDRIYTYWQAAWRAS